MKELRKHNVYVYFDKEKIDTARPDYEIILTIYSEFAQEESLLQSKNGKWGMRVKMKRGELPAKTVYGYRKINNELTIFDKEANVVKVIFHEYVRGRTLKQIKEILEDFNIKSPSGKDKWDCKTINNLVSIRVINERFFLD